MLSQPSKILHTISVLRENIPKPSTFCGVEMLCMTITYKNAKLFNKFKAWLNKKSIQLLCFSGTRIADGVFIKSDL